MSYTRPPLLIARGAAVCFALFVLTWSVGSAQGWWRESPAGPAPRASQDAGPEIETIELEGGEGTPLDQLFGNPAFLPSSKIGVVPPLESVEVVDPAFMPSSKGMMIPPELIGPTLESAVEVGDPVFLPPTKAGKLAPPFLPGSKSGVIVAPPSEESRTAEQQGRKQ